MTPPVPKKEQEEVSAWWLKLEAAKKVAEEEKSLWDQLKDALAGKFPWVVPISKLEETQVKAGRLGWTDQVVTNFALRCKNDVDAQVGEGVWVVEYPRSGDVPDKSVTEVETLVEKVIDAGGAVREFAATVPDVLTMGSSIVWTLIGRDVLDQSRLDGMATDAGDLIARAAQGEVVHPLKGMNYFELANAALAFADDKDQAILMTEAQDANVRRLAVEAAQMHDEEQKEAPGDLYTYGDIRYVRTPYYTWCLIDSSVMDRKYARWMARRVVLTLDEARNLKAWKKKAREAITPSELGRDVGMFPEYGQEVSDAVKQQLKTRVDVWEIHDRDTNQIHYIARGYDGYLEIDPRSPYVDETGQPLFQDYFPVEFCTPRQNNLERARRALGDPVLAAMWPKQLLYIKIESAFCAGVKKAARMYELAKGVDDDTRDAIERGVDGTTVQRPEALKDGEEAVKTIRFDNVPVDYMQGMIYLQEQIARDCEMSGPAMLGRNVTPTLGQEEMASSGAASSRGGLIARLEGAAGGICDKTVAMIRRFYSNDKVSKIMGAEFTAKVPMQNDMGQPVMDPMTGQPILLPSMWDQFRSSSLCGDKIEVKFGPRGRGEQLARIKVLTDVGAYLNTRLDPLGLPLYETRPVDEQIARLTGVGRLKDYVPSKAEIMLKAQQLMPPGPGGDGDGDEGGEREAEGGGREDGRAAGGRRGPPASPGRHERHRGPPDRGDMETKVRRTNP